MTFKLSPRVVVYPCGSQAPCAESGTLALARLLRDSAGSGVFGDGSHPTTRLCAGVLDLLCRQRRPEAVLDVGTGTGILARIARARGAQVVAGTDIDSAALASARAHAQLDEHPLEIHLSAEAPDHWGARFDIAVANILEGPLRDLAPALSRALRPGGVLLISGFTRPQAPALRIHFERAGLAYERECRLDDWVLLAFRQNGS